MEKYQDGFFTLAVKDAGPAVNHAERIIGYAVVVKKISFYTMSAEGTEAM